MPPKKIEKDTVDDVPSNLINSEKFKNFIKFIVQEENAILLKELNTLKEEVVILRESNIQLINLLTNNNYNNNVTNLSPGKNERINNKIIPTSISNPKHTYAHAAKTLTNTNHMEKVADKEQGPSKNNVQNSDLKRDEQTKPKFNKKKNNKVITGTLINDRSGGKLIGVEKKVYLHISKFKHEDADIDDVKEYIKDDVDISKVDCEKLKTYFGDHTYFKLGIPHESFDTLFNADYWPRGVEISKFLFRSKRGTDEQSTNITGNK